MDNPLHPNALATSIQRINIIMHSKSIKPLNLTSKMSYTELSVALFTSMGRRDHDFMVAAFSTTCAISAYHH